jgi:hypothetical protein
MQMTEMESLQQSADMDAAFRAEYSYVPQVDLEAVDFEALVIGGCFGFSVSKPVEDPAGIMEKEIERRKERLLRQIATCTKYDWDWDIDPYCTEVISHMAQSKDMTEYYNSL